MKAKRKLFDLWVASLAIGTVVIGLGIAHELLDPSSVMVRAASGNPGGSALADFDGDGIPNVADNLFNRMNANLADSDGDGFPDGFEVGTGSNPADPTSVPQAPFVGANVLVAPDGPDVYIVFVSASASLFQDIASSTANIVKHKPGGRLAYASLPVGPAFLSKVTKLRSNDGSVVSFTLRVPRSSVGMWTIGFGLRDIANNVHCNDLFIHRRSNGNVYAIHFSDESNQRTFLEPTERDTPSSSGYKECVQVSLTGQNSNIRQIISERCETRDFYECVADCGVLAGATIIRLDQQWLY